MMEQSAGCLIPVVECGSSESSRSFVKHGSSKCVFEIFLPTMTCFVRLTPCIPQSNEGSGATMMAVENDRWNADGPTRPATHY